MASKMTQSTKTEKTVATKKNTNTNTKATPRPNAQVTPKAPVADMAKAEKATKKFVAREWLRKRNGDGTANAHHCIATIKGVTSGKEAQEVLAKYMAEVDRSIQELYPGAAAGRVVKGSVAKNDDGSFQAKLEYQQVTKQVKPWASALLKTMTAANKILN